jgi:hypothetical protein
VAPVAAAAAAASGLTILETQVFGA